MMALHEHSLYDDHHSRYDKTTAGGEGGMYLGLKDEKRHTLLTTPDVSVFALSTPEVQKMLSSVSTTTTSNSMIRTPTPSSLPMMRHPAPVTMEQEMYAAGFLERLEALQAYDPHGRKVETTEAVHHSSGSTYSSQSNPSLEAVAPTYVTATFVDRLPNFATQTIPEPTYSDSTTDYYASSYGMPYRHEAAMMPGATTGYTVLAGNPMASSYGVLDAHQKNSNMLHEMTAVPDMKTQEHMKIERKKARNRIAASKCRERRLQRESELQAKVRILKEHNKELNEEVNGLKEQISSLKTALVHHMKTGCKVSMPANLVSSSPEESQVS